MAVPKSRAVSWWAQHASQRDKGRTATQRLQHAPQDDGARVHGHLWRDSMIDEAHEAQLVGIRFANRPRLDGGHFDLRRSPRHSALPRSTLAACNDWETSSLPW